MTDRNPLLRFVDDPRVIFAYTAEPSPDAVAVLQAFEHTVHAVDGRGRQLDAVDKLAGHPSRILIWLPLDPLAVKLLRRSPGLLRSRRVLWVNLDGPAKPSVTRDAEQLLQAHGFRRCRTAMRPGLFVHKSVAPQDAPAAGPAPDPPGPGDLPPSFAAAVAGVDVDEVRQASAVIRETGLQRIRHEYEPEPTAPPAPEPELVAEFRPPAADPAPPADPPEPTGQPEHGVHVAPPATAAAERPIVVTMTAYRRPEYTRQVLDSLAKCDGVGDWLFLPHIEPAKDQKVRAAVREAFTDFAKLDACEVRPHYNRKRKGLNLNTQAAMRRALKLNPRTVVHIEDDTVLAVDALNYFAWGVDQLRELPDKFVLVSGYNKKHPPTAAEHYRAGTRKVFTPWGWAVDKRRLVWLLAEWCTNNPKCFTCRIKEKFQATRREIFPHVSRVQNIGYEKGENDRTAEWYEKHHRTDCFAGDVPDLVPGAPDRFRLLAWLD